VSQKVLTATLRGLERDGFVARTVTPTIPPRVDYALTALGRDVLVPVAALAEWALAHRARVHAARAAYDAAVAGGVPAAAGPSHARLDGTDGLGRPTTPATEDDLLHHY
jgi:hypothetical protein